jgi:hypothetical protein
MAAYATAAELAAYTNVAITDQGTDDRMLQRATDQINTALIGLFYATDTLGNPLDANQILGLKNATCAQVEYWRATGDELGLAEDYASFTIGSVSLNRGGKATAPKPRGPVLCPRAIQHLRMAGMWPVIPVVW